MSAELLIVFIFGLLWGSFANVVIYRWPKNENVVWPPSRCPKCQKRIRWYHNIPVLSWVLLRGRCADCKTWISWRYPLVELIMGMLFAAIFYQYGSTWVTFEYWVFAWGLVTVSFIDLDHMLLPDVITLPGIAVGLAGAALNPEREFWPAFAGVLMGGGFLWLIAYLYLLWRKEEGMGGGDIKLLAWIGAVLTWSSIPFVILSASILGSVMGVVLALRSKAGLRSVIPFGPYLAIAALLYLFGGDKIGLWYIGLFLPAGTLVN